LLPEAARPPGQSERTKAGVNEELREASSENGIPADIDEPRLVSETGIAQRIAGVITPALRTLGFRLVRVKTFNNNGMVVQIMAERPDGTMTVGDCETASTDISPLLEVEDPIAGEYNLEVSSPGIDRPLVRVSDFLRAIGHEARVELIAPIDGRRRFRGWIEGVDGTGSAATLRLRRIDARAEEPSDVVLPLRDLSEARLSLTEALIRETLRAAKKAEEAGDPAPPDENDGTAEPPRRGPGRFARRNGEKRISPNGVRPLKPNPRGAGRAPR
jgi:ribosome maturation factor RimP